MGATCSRIRPPDGAYIIRARDGITGKEGKREGHEKGARGGGIPLPHLLAENGRGVCCCLMLNTMLKDMLLKKWKETGFFVKKSKSTTLYISTGFSFSVIIVRKNANYYFFTYQLLLFYLSTITFLLISSANYYFFTYNYYFPCGVIITLHI